MQLKRGLGRGLESLIPPAIAVPSLENQTYRKISLDAIVPNRLQPRTVFDEDKIRELSESIREQGIIQPLIVSAMNDGRYELIAGERRLRACRLAGLTEVPVVIKTVDDEGLLALSLIENIQREDLNSIEEARAYQELADQFGFTQDDISKKVGKSRSAVTNSMRLLALPRIIQDDLAAGRYTAGHARALLAIESLHDQLKFREKLLREVTTVRDIEKMVQTHINGGKKQKNKAELSPQMNELADQMKNTLGTKVQLTPKGKGGKIIIDYYSPQDLDRIFSHIVNI